MNRHEALRVIDLLPRYFPKKRCWSPQGTHIYIALPCLPNKIDALVTQIMARRRYARDCIEWLDLSGGRIYVIQQSFKIATLRYAIRHLSRMQYWSRKRLPIVVRLFKGSILIVWNGHHRVVASRLLGRKLRCRVVEPG